MTGQLGQIKKLADDIKASLGEPSLIIAAEDSLRKNLLVASASYYEYELGRRIEQVFSAQGGSEECLAVISKKAVSRQFYSYFDFEVRNTNKLFSHFGQRCKERAAKEIRDSDDLKDAQDCFLDICSLRNSMVHQNFSAFNMDISADEVYEKFKKGLIFLDFFERMIAGGGASDSADSRVQTS